MVTIVFDTDDVHPQVDFGLLKEFDNLKYHKKLYDEFGLKSTLFVIPFYEEKDEYNLENHREWIQWLKEQPHIEIANHGYSHSNKNPQQYGCQEFLDKSPEETEERLRKSIRIFENVGVKCVGFKMPGWGIMNYHYPIISKYFKYIGDHFIGSSPIVTDTGLYRIPYTLSIDNLHSFFYTGNDIVIVHSHISRKNGGNKNAIDDKLYNDFRHWLKIIIEKNNENVEYKFMRDLVL